MANNISDLRCTFAVVLLDQSIESVSWVSNTNFADIPKINTGGIARTRTCKKINFSFSLIKNLVKKVSRFFHAFLQFKIWLICPPCQNAIWCIKLSKNPSKLNITYAIGFACNGFVGQIGNWKFTDIRLESTTIQLKATEPALLTHLEKLCAFGCLIQSLCDWMSPWKDLWKIIDSNFK